MLLFLPPQAGVDWWDAARVLVTVVILLPFAATWALLRHLPAEGAVAASAACAYALSRFFAWRAGGVRAAWPLGAASAHFQMLAFVHALGAEWSAEAYAAVFALHVGAVAWACARGHPVLL